MGWFSRKKQPARETSEPAGGVDREAIVQLLRLTKKTAGQAFVGSGDCDKCGFGPIVFATAKNEPRTVPCPQCQHSVYISTLAEFDE